MTAIGKPAKPNLLSLVSKQVLVIELGVFSLNSKVQSCSSSNSRDKNIYKSKMAAIRKPAKPYLQRLVSKQVSVIGLGVISLSPIALETAELNNQFHFWPPGRQQHHLQMIPSGLAIEYGCFDTLNTKIHLQTAEIIFSSIFGHQGGSGTTCKWSYHVGEIDMVIKTP